MANINIYIIGKDKITHIPSTTALSSKLKVSIELQFQLKPSIHTLFTPLFIYYNITT
jgi:hypothetical protein